MPRAPVLGFSVLAASSHKASPALPPHGLTSAKFEGLCFLRSRVIFSSSELGSRGRLYSSSSSASEPPTFSFSASESCFFLADAISAACRLRHLVRRFWNHTWGGGVEGGSSSGGHRGSPHPTSTPDPPGTSAFRGPAAAEPPLARRSQDADSRPCLSTAGTPAHFELTFTWLSVMPRE